MAAIDYTVCLHSEVFVTTQGGNFPHFLLGHRRYLYGGHAKTIRPDKRKLALLFDNPNIGYVLLFSSIFWGYNKLDAFPAQKKFPLPLPLCFVDIESNYIYNFGRSDIRQGSFEENILLLYWTGENLLGKLFGKLGYWAILYTRIVLLYATLVCQNVLVLQLTESKENVERQEALLIGLHFCFSFVFEEP